MKAVSNNPTKLDIESIVKSLQKKFPEYAFLLKLECWAHSSGTKSSKVSLSILPGMYESDCDIHGPLSWKSFLGLYHELMNREEIQDV